MKLARKKIYLITGGAGFIGSNFVHYLYEKEENIEVRVLDKLTYAANLRNLKEFESRRGFEFIRGDICDAKVVKKAMAGAQVVVNFAAETAVDRSIDDPQSFLKTDIFGVYVLLNEARKNKNLKKFIQISTDEVYGQILKGSFMETSPLNPRNPYSASKLGGDRLAYSFFATYRLPVTITRASNNYGPWAYLEKVIPLFITNLIDGRKIPVYGEGKQIRDWLYVKDHCTAIYLLTCKGADGEVYNIGGGQECTNIALARQIIKLMGKTQRDIEFVQDRPGHDFRYSLDCSKLKKLGWEPQYNLAKGLQETVEWYGANENWWRPVKQKMDQKYLTGYWGRK
ncbi:MAG TPA: dTDP-glucose 4,6-dehydratase [Candidatus Omnitrophota bacterium]|nr:dTDP-glucose 4,6-dehydratase [Candidatus Omnitrophota bacterium]HPD84086.1 dTDP-glucose 4,6-dehydratase [Candidatus Omnitrophota bacterium]HRZ02943.1 dTDP-glucose 4,6-dehydratase [Candidatus Omnitrophota bacterium]